MLLGPVMSQLGTKRLLVVPDGALQYVPFAALPDPRRTGGAPLVLAHEIVTIPSATALAVLRRDLDRGARAPKALAVVADPVFTRDDPRLAGVPAAATVVASAAGPRSRAVEEGVGAGEIPRLEFSRREAQTIAQLVPAADLLQALDFDANRSTLMGGSLGDYRIVHIATHGFLNGSNPALSGLLLSKVDAKGQPRDGLVLSHEIYGMNLSADLVVLSACRTGLGKDVRGEGIIGLTRGFMYAGARRVVVSLWSVDDQATAELMGRFYESMLRGRRPPAAALRTAQVAMWNEGKYRFPYYWAAFVVQGEWR
jgi:CHAT domain-containing protein